MPRVHSLKYFAWRFHVSVPAISVDDAKAYLESVLLSMLANLELSLRAHASGFTNVRDSSIRHAFMMSSGTFIYAGAMHEQRVITQMNQVGMRLQQAVDKIMRPEAFPGAVLDAAVAMLDAETAITGAAPSEELRASLEGIKELMLEVAV